MSPLRPALSRSGCTPEEGVDDGMSAPSCSTPSQRPFPRLRSVAGSEVQRCSALDGGPAKPRRAPEQRASSGDTVKVVEPIRERARLGGGECKSDIGAAVARLYEAEFAITHGAE